MFGYFFATVAFSTLIQELRFSAVSPQETMAIFPLLPMALARVSTVYSPIPCPVAWETKAARTEFGASVSDVRTLIPASCACFIIGASELGSFGATMRTSTFCWMSERTTVSYTHLRAHGPY